MRCSTPTAPSSRRFPGTTRDLLTEQADIGGLSLSLIDTAGVRDTADVVEQEGVARAKAAVAVADLTIVLLDRSRPLSYDDRELLGVTASRPRVVAWNKIDLPPSQPLEPLDPIEARRDLGDDRRRHRSSDRGDWRRARHWRSASRSSAGHQRASRGSSRARQGIPHARGRRARIGTSPKNFRCSISRKPAPRCRKSPGDERPTICSVTSSNASASANRQSGDLGSRIERISDPFGDLVESTIDN